MPHSPASKRLRLLSPWTLLLISVLVGAVLVMSFSGEDVFLPDGKQPDEVSVNYAELLLKADPDNHDLRVTLIEQLIELGDFPRARKHLARLAPANDTEQTFYTLELDVLQALATTESLEPEQRLEMVKRLQSLPRQQLTAAQLTREASYALALEAPSLAAAIYQELAELDTIKRDVWLNEAAKWYLASSEPAKAASVYVAMLASAQTPDERVRLITLAVNSQQAAGLNEEAAVFLSQHIDALSPGDIELLQKGITVGLASSRFDLAEQFVRLWRSWKPDDTAALQADFDLQMAAGHIKAAWPLGQQLVVLEPENTTLLMQMGQLGEWISEPSEALGYWVRLLAIEDDPSIREHAWRLATQLFDFDQAIPLLAMLGEQRLLTDEEVDTLIYSYESLGDPESADHWLRGYVQHQPQHHHAWTRWQQLLERTQQFKAEAQVWAQIDKRFGVTTAERVLWAETHWKRFDEAAAFKVLLAADSTTIKNADYWHARVELAWSLERDEDVQYAYQQLVAMGETLSRADEGQLISIYMKTDPQQALVMLARSWERTHDLDRLVVGLSLAEQLGDWKQMRAFVDSAQGVAGADDLPDLWSARHSLAIYDGRVNDAERFLLQALKRFPRQNTFRVQLVWFYIDQNRRDDLTQVLAKWLPAARRDSTLWLAFANANLLINRNDHAMVWFKRYLNANPDDLLAGSAFADALFSSGYKTASLKMRSQLLKQMQAQSGAMDVDTFTTYLRLLSTSQSLNAANVAATQRRGVSQPMLQVWFEQYIAQLESNNQADVSAQWLAWGRHQGLKINRYDDIVQALRTMNRDQLAKQLAAGGLGPAQQIEMLSALGYKGEAHALALSNITPEQTEETRNQLRSAAFTELDRTPQGIQLGWNSQDFGGLKFRGPQATIAQTIGDNWYAKLELEEGRYDSDELDESALGTEKNTQLLLRRDLADGQFGLILDSSIRKDQNRLGFGLFRSLELTSKDELRIDFDWHRDSDESGFMRALGMRDAIALGGRHNITARDQLNWRVGHQRFETRQGDDIGNGQQYDLEYSHTLFFEGPTWAVRSGVTYQTNNLSGDLPNDLLASQGGPLVLETDPNSTGISAETFLQDRFGQAYIGSTWQRGFPGSLNRGRPQYTWFVDVLSGWQWVDHEINYSINTGIGFEVLGDDELGVSVGYQSAPQSGDGEAGGTAAVTYSARFGR